MPFINKMTKQTSNTKTYMYKMIYNTLSVHCDKKLSVSMPQKFTSDGTNICQCIANYHIIRNTPTLKKSPLNLLSD